ncbi:hypothetical protein AB3S75_031966 [Citrus x aurantiifolia]
MKTKPKNTSLWNWSEKNKKSNNRKQFPVTEFLQEYYRKFEEQMMGPGVGVGIGCGIGAGFGVAGGIGYGGCLEVVFGVGMGCGVGFGFGYGRGFGHGIGLDGSKPKITISGSQNRFAIDY